MMTMIKRMKYSLLFLLGLCLPAFAQQQAPETTDTVVPKPATIKSVVVADKQSFTDHIALVNDATDKDLMVKFQFDEGKNTLTVSVISYRTLFVFWADTPYKGTIKGRKLRHDRLPYPVTVNEGDQFRLGKLFRKSLPKPRKKYVFQKWIAYEGLQPQEKELMMVNDYIEQTFDIQNKRNNVVVRLRDLMLLDATRRKGKATRYEVTYGQNLDTEYQITIQRNPCFGLEEQVGAAQKSLAAISKSYTTFKKRYAKKTVASDDALKAFKELKATLAAQFPKNEETSACPDIQQAHDQYNLYVDSIAAVKVVLETDVPSTEGIFDAKTQAKNAQVILANARQIDNLVARWIISRDEVERDDLITQIRGIIKDTNIIIKSSGRLSAEVQRTVDIFRQAEKYFNRTCK